MSDRIVCHCHNISQEQIVEAIKAGAKTAEEVGKVTGGAGMICGSCITEIEGLIWANSQE